MDLVYPDPTLSDGVVTLRPWDESDLDCVEEAATDPRIPAGTTVPAVFSAEDGLAFIRRQRQRISRGDGVSLAVVDASSDRSCGLVWLAVRPQPRVRGLGYWMVPSARGRGWATRAVRLAVEWALEDQRVARVEAWVEPENLPSQRLLATAGFVREGVLRSFLEVDGDPVDAVVFSRTPSDEGGPVGGVA
jgi:RimJ/RimL family protein N-acetyltransferase